MLRGYPVLSFSVMRTGSHRPASSVVSSKYLIEIKRKAGPGYGEPLGPILLSLVNVRLVIYHNTSFYIIILSFKEIRLSV